MDSFILPTLFKAISVTFSSLAIYTGVRGLFGPVEFARYFGIPLGAHRTPSPQVHDHNADRELNIAKTYVRLMSVRQLSTGIILVIFSLQRKWLEVGTILVVIGVLVAGTDGFYIARREGMGTWGAGAFHAIPGGLIAGLAWVFVRRGTAVN